MKKKFFLLSVLFFLLIGCSRVEDNSPVRRRIGNNNGIVFQEIPYTPWGEANRTYFGFSGVRFAGNAGSYAIVSIPAGEENASTFVYAIITPERRSPNLMLMTYRDSPNFHLLLNGQSENMRMNVNSSHEQRFRIGIRGNFTPYRQENMVLISFTNEHFTDEQGAERELLQLDSLQRYFLGENTLFVLPLPWHTIRVRIDGGEEDVHSELIRWANTNVFSQAIVRLKLVEEGEDYDARVALGQKVLGRRDVAFLDENGNVFDPHRSNRIVSANLRFSELYVLEWDESRPDPQLQPAPDRDAFLKRFSYAVAFLMGVSQDGSSNNLMHSNSDGTENNNINYRHLSFRQWNQLRAKGGGR